MRRLKSIEVISSRDRNSSIDVFRSLAIISVVLFHYNHFLPFGEIGVDLFFVISGLLVGRLLTKHFQQGERINFFKFFLQRGFKIWPSFYTFLILGNIAAYLFYSDLSPQEYIPLWDIKRYLFFYQNYTGAPYHWSFDHVWSLCVEEHFYILLPIGFVLLQSYKAKPKMLFISIGFIIIAGFIFKALVLYYTNSKDTYSATHNRIDALAWGVLLNLIIAYQPNLFENRTKNIKIFLLGIMLFISTLLIAIYYESVFYYKVIFHSIIPFSFFLMLFGTFNLDFSNFKVLRFIAYYSYNWYLWHAIFVLGVNYYFGNTVIGLLSYLVISFLAAMFFTIVLEEPLLKRRNKVIQKLFRNRDKVHDIEVTDQEVQHRA